MNKQKLSDIRTIVSKMGQNVVSGSQYDLIQVWKSWYRGAVNDFHYYNVKTVNGKTLKRQKLTFGLPKKIAEDWISLLLNENVTIATDNDDINEQLDRVFDDNNVRVELCNLLEKVFGYAGTGATVEYLIDGVTMIDYISGELMLITEGTNSTATGICTINEIEKDDKFITHLTIHTLVDGKYIVEHQAYMSTKSTELGSQSRQALRVVFSDDVLQTMETPVIDEKGNQTGVKYVVIYDTDIPTFQIYKPNLTNNYDVMSKDGIPVIANSIDGFKALDDAYHGLNNESVNNTTLTVFSDKATRKRAIDDPEAGTTSYINYVDEANTRYISVPMSDTEDWVKHFKGEFDSEPYITTINRNLSWISFKVGLGTGYYSFDGGDTYVNEKQIISTNNDTWKNKVKHEILLRQSLEGLVKAIVFLEQSQGRMPNVEYKVVIKFDDSIILDDEQLKKDSLELVNLGFKPKWKHLVEWFSMTEDEAKMSVAQAREEQDQLAMDFIDSFNPDEDE